MINVIGCTYGVVNGGFKHNSQPGFNCKLPGQASSVHEWTKPRVVVADRTLLCVTQGIAGNKSHMQFLMRICRYRYMGIVSYSGRQAVHGASSVYPLSLALIVSDDSNATINILATHKL